MEAAPLGASATAPSRQEEEGGPTPLSRRPCVFVFLPFGRFWFGSLVRRLDPLGPDVFFVGCHTKTFCRQTEWLRLLLPNLSATPRPPSPAAATGNFANHFFGCMTNQRTAHRGLRKFGLKVRPTWRMSDV